MARKNYVEVTLSGDATDLEKAFADVGVAAEKMGSKVGEVSDTKFGGFGDRAVEGFDIGEQRAMGFRDTLTGMQDSIKGIGELAKGNFSFDSLLTVGAGVGDLASGFSNFLIPAFSKAVGWVKNLTIVQAALNLVMSLNPIMLIVIAIGLLVGAFILLWNKSQAFRDFWVGAWELIKGAAEAVGTWFRDTLWHGILEPVFQFIHDKATAVFDFFRELPGKIGGWLSGIGDTIKNAFIGAFNWVTDRFNDVIGGINAGIRGFNAINPFGDVPEIPKLPRFHTGGVVPGVPGQEVLGILQAGERVIPRGQGGVQTLVIETDGRRASLAIAQLFAESIKGSGLKLVTR